MTFENTIDIQTYIQENGEYFTLFKKRRHEVYVDPFYPNASMYKVYDTMNNYLVIGNLSLKEKMIHELKKIYNIVDVWDTDKEYFREKSHLLTCQTQLIKGKKFIIETWIDYNGNYYLEKIYKIKIISGDHVSDENIFLKYEDVLDYRNDEFDIVYEDLETIKVIPCL